MIRSYDSIFAVDGVPMLTPDIDQDVSETDIDDDDSGRDESKVMHRFVIREKVKTWSFNYALLDGEDLDYIKSLFSGRHEFTFTYDRNIDGDPVTVRAYCSKRSYKKHGHYKQNGLYKDMKFNIIEC